MTSPTLYLTWQDTRTTRRWYTVGRLRRLPSGPFEFVYTKEFLKAQREAGMQPLLGLEDPTQRYLSESLFPHFANRLMSPSREEFAPNLARLGLDDFSDPLVVLARSAGRRETDSFQLFAAPEEITDTAGSRLYMIKFFVHGTRYVPEVSLDDAAGKPLRLLWDFQNPADANAVMIVTEDNRLLGWVPRYYSSDLLQLRERGVVLKTTIDRLTPPPAPPWYRLLVSLRAPWPDGFWPLTSSDDRPLADLVASEERAPTQ